MSNFLSECMKITGAVIDGDYRDYSNGGGYFTPEGEIIDNGNQHPIFQLDPNEIIQLEIQGHLDYKRTVSEYIKIFELTTTHFSTT